MIQPINYYELPGLKNIYFEDSYVLNIRSSSTSVQFLLDLVVTKNHPRYQPPLPQKQYCYKQALLKFN
jgi:hypothetical protein